MEFYCEQQAIQMDAILLLAHLLIDFAHSSKGIVPSNILSSNIYLNDFAESFIPLHFIIIS